MYDHGKECRKYSVSLIYTSSVPDKCKYYSQASGCSFPSTSTMTMSVRHRLLTGWATLTVWTQISTLQKAKRNRKQQIDE